MRTIKNINELFAAISSLISSLSGKRTYITAGVIMAIGSIPPTQRIVYGDFDWTLEMWQLLEQASVPLFALLGVFLRAAIAKLPAALAAIVTPIAERMVEEARRKLLDELRPDVQPAPKPDDLNFENLNNITI